MPARILIAEEESVMGLIVQGLDGYELLQATAFSEAKRLVCEHGISLFIIGIHFDDSQAMALVKFIRTEKHHKETPIVIVRLLPSKNANMLRQTLDVMKTIQGISDYLELVNDPQASNKIRAAVDNCLPETACSSLA
jgi:response regulator RpfG family c-di-GMP phosphodiesterase